MTVPFVIAVSGCVWISDADRSQRWDVDQDGVGRPFDCDDGDPALQFDCASAPTIPTVPTVPTTDTIACGEPPVASVAVTEVVGTQGETVFAVDAAASTGTDLSYRFDWGDGLGEPSSEPTSDHVYDVPGWSRLAVEVVDGCARTASDEVWVAVAAPGQLLWVTTPEDNDVDGLSLRSALALAAAEPGAQVITFEAGLGPVLTGLGMAPLSDAGGILIGDGATLDGRSGGWVDVAGAGAVVAGLGFVGFTGPAVRLSGGGAIAQGLEVHDSGGGLVVDAGGVLVRDVVMYGNGSPQLALNAQASVADVDVAEGTGAGVTITPLGSGSSLVRCAIHGNATAGVEIQEDTDDVSILDSTLVGNGGDGLWIGDKRVDRLDVRNVILAFNGGWGMSGKRDAHAAGSPSYDVWFGNGAGSCAQCDLGDGSLTVDPLLADVGGGDLTPLPDSPVIDAGTAATGVDRTGPTEGMFFGEGPDIGAVEVR